MQQVLGVHFYDVGEGKHHEPNFVAIESYRAIGDLLRSPDVARSFAYDLSVQLLGSSATTLLVSEYTRDEVHNVMLELAVADGVIELATRTLFGRWRS